MKPDQSHGARPIETLEFWRKIQAFVTNTSHNAVVKRMGERVGVRWPSRRHDNRLVSELFILGTLRLQTIAEH